MLNDPLGDRKNFKNVKFWSLKRLKNSQITLSDNGNSYVYDIITK